jgi:hypothetical protein
MTGVEQLMTFRKMLGLPVALLIAVSTLSAFQAGPVDVTGVWTGTLTPITATQSSGQQTTLQMDLKQKGEDVTGTVGETPERQLPIANGKVTTVKGVTSVTFEVTPPSGIVLKLDLTAVEGRLKGKAMREANGEKQEAVVDFGRKK